MKLVLTFGIVSCSACALGSVHGFAGVGLGFDGQLNVAICAEPFPAGNVTFTDTGAAAKFAVTDSAALIVTVHVGEVVELAHAPPHPANVDGEAALSVSVTIVPV